MKSMVPSRSNMKQINKANNIYELNEGPVTPVTSHIQKALCALYHTKEKLELAFSSLI